MLSREFLYWQPKNPKLLIKLKLTLCRIYLLLYILKKNIRNATTIRNSSTAVTTPAIISEFAEWDVGFTERDVEFESSDVNFPCNFAKITKMYREIDGATEDLSM